MQLEINKTADEYRRASHYWQTKWGETDTKLTAALIRNEELGKKIQELQRKLSLALDKTLRF